MKLATAGSAPPSRIIGPRCQKKKSSRSTHLKLPSLGLEALFKAYIPDYYEISTAIDSLVTYSLLAPVYEWRNRNSAIFYL